MVTRGSWPDGGGDIGDAIGAGSGHRDDAGYVGAGMEVWPGGRGRWVSRRVRPGRISVVSEVAEQVVLCLFDEGGAETRLPLPGFDGGVWHGFAAASGTATG
jgi:predicted carbohydrate-binding protein with CBM48